MDNPLTLALGLLIWVSVMWDGFATIVLPRTVAPMKRLSGRFYNRSWRLWSLIGRAIRTDDRRLAFLAIYGPLSVMLLAGHLGRPGRRRLRPDLPRDPDRDSWRKARRSASGRFFI